jgi:hypothetical protein
VQRSIFIVLLVLLVGGIVAVGFAWRQANTSSSTPTPIACQVVDIQGTPNLQIGLAIDSMYESMPLMKTPVAVVATQEKPFAVGCVLPGD